MRELDMRYVGQEYTVRVGLEGFDHDTIKRRFDEVHQMTYAHSAPEEPAEVVNYRLSASARIPRPLLEKIAEGNRKPPSQAIRGKRDVYFGELGKSLPTAVYDRNQLLASNRIEGPAVIEEKACTTLILPEYAGTIDDYGNIVIEKA